LEELDEERRFLLDSIRDLDAERAAGDVDDADFQALRDGYVARAGAVLREIDDGRSSLLPKPDRPWWRTAVVIGITLAVAVALGLFVANSAGQRLPGQSLTGGQQADEIALQLAEGRRLLGSEPVASRAAYDRVIELEPGHPEATTYSAYLLVLAGQQSGDQAKVREGVAAMKAAAQLDPSYGDPHCLLAVAGGNFLDPPDADLVLAEGETCLALNPPAEMLGQIQGLIARFGGAPVTTIGSDDIETLLAQAEAAQTVGDYSGALNLYQRVLELDAGNLAAQSYSAYLVALNGRDTGKPDQVEQGIELLQTIAERDPDYADAHCLLTLAGFYFVDEPDTELVRVSGERCLALDAPTDIVSFVQTVLSEIAAG